MYKQLDLFNEINYLDCKGGRVHAKTKTTRSEVGRRQGSDESVGASNGHTENEKLGSSTKKASWENIS
jgi:hypothetical protein